ncbi:septin-2-like [Protopterus annectens]|uniref:septin-2-like n=1 Tax=Protopterus annectens TaxID=7888 RepID=UPI001CF9CC1C|nr:septin-2-like [Protopterus annectens]
MYFLILGESGLGKSTLINSLFLTDLYPERVIPGAAEKIERTVEIEASTVEIEERGVKLRLTVVDTPGYGDAINSEDCFRTIISYIDEQFERYLHDESGLNRRHIVDNRVHCCFYFISPFGHGLKPLDLQFMKAVHHKMNVVPVIAKADTLTLKERERLKRRILDEIDEHGIKIYQLPDAESDEDEDYKEQTRILKTSIPFCVVGSNQLIETKGKKVRGRLYPWGAVEVENPEHNDFLKLRTMLITHMQDLQEVTQDLHYENFRSERLKCSGRLSSHGYVLPLSPLKGAEIDEDVSKDRILLEKEAELAQSSSGVAGLAAGTVMPVYHLTSLCVIFYQELFPNLASIIDLDQCGFIENQQTFENILNDIDYINSTSTKRSVCGESFQQSELEILEDGPLQILKLR